MSNMTDRAYTRGVLAVVAITAALVAASAPLSAADLKRHAISLVGEPAYPPDYTHFKWVNPDAPKGGRLRQSIEGTFDSLNQFPVQGQPAAGLGLVYEQLFTSSPDEASTEYAHVASSVSYPPDFSAATFELRPQARFHDGKPITVEDVIFSFETLKKASPFRAAYWKDVVAAEKTGEREVTFRFSSKNNRELPLIISQLTVLPKHWWEGKNASGEPRDIMKSSIELPLGSGPYRVRSFEVGREIVLERVKDWWAKDLPLMKGQYNFDELQLVYFRDHIAPFESFKSGNIDYWVESSAKQWATEFDFDAVKKGWVKKLMPPRGRGASMQGYYINTRRQIFQDPRVRRALNLAFDFEWANKNLFYGLYTRTSSYFENSVFAAKGLPTGRELEILNEVKDKVPPEVFTTEWKNPVSATPEDARKNLMEAVRLLREAGWTARQETIDDPSCGIFCKVMMTVGLRSARTETVLRNAAGTPLAFEILSDNPSWDRIIQPYKGSLEKLGFKVSIRQIDSAQYKRRTDTFDFDMIVDNIAQSESPGNEQRDFWGSAAATRQGSRNSIGIADPAIDKLIDKVIFATDRADLIAATKALDRVLLWHHFVVPHWYTDKERIAMWDKFAGPAVQPTRSFAFFQTWWWNDAAARKLQAARGN